MIFTIHVTQLQDSALLAKILAQCATAGIIFLKGDLGSGKTTLAGSWLKALGHVGAVKSPTYTLVEPYSVSGVNIYHFDLYRLNDPFELELMGFRDYIDSHHLLLIEWPEKGDGLLPRPDLTLEITAQAFNDTHPDNVSDTSNQVLSSRLVKLTFAPTYASVAKHFEQLLLANTKIAQHENGYFYVK